MESNILKFAEVLQELIIEEGIKPYKLAKEISVADTSMYAWLRKERLPSLALLIKLAGFFDCSLDFLVGRSSENYKYTKNYNYNLANSIKKKVDSSKLPITKICSAAKITTGLIYDYMGGVSTPTVETLIKLADVFRCTVDELIGLEKS